jgi:hypothetical protein
VNRWCRSCLCRFGTRIGCLKPAGFQQVSLCSQRRCALPGCRERHGWVGSGGTTAKRMVLTAGACSDTAVWHTPTAGRLAHGHYAHPLSPAASRSPTVLVSAPRATPQRAASSRTARLAKNVHQHRSVAAVESTSSCTSISRGLLVERCHEIQNRYIATLLLPLTERQWHR